MSERLPYEEHLNESWKSMPLPDENMAWEDMKRRLDEEREKRPVAWWRRGCALWGFLLLLLALAGWFIYSNYNKSRDSNKEGTQTQGSLKPVDTHSSETPSVKKDMGNNDKIHPEQGTATNLPGGKTVEELEEETKKEQLNSHGIDSKLQSSVKIPGSAKKIKAGPVVNEPDPIINKSRKIPGVRPVLQKQPADDGNEKDSIQDGPGKVVDSQATKKIDSLNIVESLPEKVPEINKKDSAKDRSFRLSAGLAIQQQVPMQGQQATPYSSSGRKGSLLDYIPSVYFRITRPDKWFVQAEFKYGAPQLTRQFVFNQKAVFDSVSNTTTTTAESLRKTYYHQLPLTFQVIILKNWSLGTGIVWNRFSSAVSEQTVSFRVPGTQIDSVVSNEIIRSNADSVFTKNYFQAVFETQIQWKRFSLGGRYAFGLQPYIRFTLPGGQRQEEKNSSLQLFLRYRLWEK